MLSLNKKTIIKVAAPIMIGTFIQNIVMITDAILVNKLGTIAFNAANNAGLLFIVFFMISKGLGDGTQIQIAKEYGLDERKSLNSSINHSFISQVVLSVVLIVLLYLSMPLFTQTLVKNHNIGLAMNDFLSYRIWGLLFAGIQLSAMAFFIGIGKTRIIIFSSILLATLNIFLDFGLIYGYFGLPEMGVGGAGLASSIAEAITAIFLVIVLIKNKAIHNYQFTFIKRISLKKIQHLLKLSYPLMGSGFLSIATWYIFFSLIEQRGAFELEVSHVVRNLFFISFIPIFGFAATTRTYVSYYHAKNEIKNVKLAIRRILLMSVSGYLIFFHGAILYPKFLLGLITDNTEVIKASVKVLRLVFGSMLIFSIVSVIYQTVAAIGKTFQSMIIEIVSIVIYLLFAYLFIIQWQSNIIVIWTVEYLYFGVTGLLSILYLLYYQKKIQND
ncbi:MAG: MATE family efflux transporter [Crocinitomicaceae bacterium]